MQNSEQPIGSHLMRELLLVGKREKERIKQEIKSAHIEYSG